ncbi:hypothetical protein [Kribbella amoyensis]|nr:hypothetical protein [Kribbella amoyensis]
MTAGRSGGAQRLHGGPIRHDGVAPWGTMTTECSDTTDDDDQR